MKLDPFYPIVPSSDWLDRLLPAGVKLVQLRVKDRDEAVVRAEVGHARDLCAAHGAVLVVNDHWQVAIEAGCDWVHLGQGDLDTADIPAIRRAGIRVGTSTHDHAELDRALSIDPDYVALGPVYETTLKQMPWAPQGLDRVAEWKRLVGARPLVAIGGLTVERAPEVLAAGADILSVVTDVVKHPEPETRARAWIDATRVD